MTVTRSEFTAKEDEFVLEFNSSSINTESSQNSFIERIDLRNVFVNQEKAEKKQQAKELVTLKNQVVMLGRLLEREQQSSSSIISKKFFIDIKIYDKDFQLYYGHDHFKYDNYVYEMKKVFKSNEDLVDARDSEKHKVVFFISWLVGNAAQIWRIKERVNLEGKHTWRDVKKTLLKHVPRVKSLNENNYVKWKFVKQQENQDVFFYYSRIAFLEFHLSENLKPNIIQQLSNFRSDLRMEHQEKLKNLLEKTDLQNLIDQVMSFEEDEALAKAHKKSKLNDRNANFNEQKNIEEGDSKRPRNERRSDNRGRGRGRDKSERGGFREDQGGNNSNHESVNRKKVFDWFNSQSKEKQNELREKKICFECDSLKHRFEKCSKNSELEFKNNETSKN